MSNTQPKTEDSSRSFSNSSCSHDIDSMGEQSLLQGTLTLQQIDQLQCQIKKYKALGMRLVESSIIKVPVDPNSIRNALAVELSKENSIVFPSTNAQSNETSRTIEIKDGSNISVGNHSHANCNATVEFVPNDYTQQNMSTMQEKEQQPFGQKNESSFLVNNKMKVTPSAKLAAKNITMSSKAAESSSKPSSAPTSTMMANMTTQPSTSSLSWQCFHSLLMVGPSSHSLQDGMISLASQVCTFT